MKILYCIPHLYNAGGMERVLTQKANWLATHTDHEITILTTERTPAGMQDTCFALDPHIQIVHLPIDFDDDYHQPLLSKWRGHMRRMRTYQRQLTEYIRAHQIELCISLGGKEIAFLKDLPCRTIVEMHFAKDQRRQLLMANHKGPLWSLLGHIRTWQLVRDVRGLERVVVLTEEDKVSWVKAGCTNVVCIPNICSLDGQKIPIKPKEWTVLAVGRLHEQKGFDLLLRAWQPIEKNHPEWTLRIVGEGPKRAELEAQIAALNVQHVCLAGRVEEVSKEYASASLFVLSSRYEGFSLVLSEAMWSGVPCIAFDCPHGPSELLADGRGWLVSNGDISALSARIEYAITHPEDAQARAKRAQAYAKETYSEQAIMPKWLQIINHKS